MSMPPDVGKNMSVRIDADMYDDLVTIMQTGVIASDAVRHALSNLAETYHNAWAAGHYPEGVAPQIIAAQLAPYDGRTTPPDARTTPVGQAGLR